MEVLFRRSDGTFIVQKGGFPYHVQQGDPLYDALVNTEEVINAEMEPTPSAWHPPPITEVSNFQARAVLSRHGLFNEVDAKVKALGGEALMAWEYGNVVTRNGNLVLAIASELGLSESEVNDLFEEANEIMA